MHDIILLIQRIFKFLSKKRNIDLKIAIIIMEQ